MTKSVSSIRGRFLTLVGLCVVQVMAMSAPVFAAEKGGVDILIRAVNRSTSDTPFCGVGGGKVGDQLFVNASMSADGSVTGTVVFKSADGPVTRFSLDRLFPFFGGILVQNQASQNTVPIWMWDKAASGGLPSALVNVEVPRGCANTKSTFTRGVDAVVMQIKYR